MSIWQSRRLRDTGDFHTGDNDIPMKSAFAESRPFLLLSLLFGISYFFVSDSNIPGVYLIAWKGAGVGFLAVYALLRLHRLDGKIVGTTNTMFRATIAVVDTDTIC